jgi:serine/threonine protein kinase
MGAVYKARQVHLDRLVALKILPPQLAQDPAFEERFLREARVLAKLSHPHIVAVYDFGHTSPQPSPQPSPLPGGEGGPHPSPLPQGEGACPPSPSGRGAGGEGAPPPEGEGGERTETSQGNSRLYYFLMEYVDGTNLRHLLRQGKLQPEQALAIVPQICEALQYAHDQGVVHRDIKPENILLDRQGRVKIADFGLAKIAGQPPAGEAAVVRQPFTLTATGQVMGTPHYMAPEQLRGTHHVDHRADIYSLGVVFYEMLTGELPIGKFAPPSCKVQVDVRLDEVVLRTLENEPERRYQRVSEVKTEVETISRTGSPQQHSTGHPEGTGGVSAPVPDAVVFRRATREGLILAVLWAVMLIFLEAGYLTKAEWYFKKEWPYGFLNSTLTIWTFMGIAFLSWWWYLLGKRPDAPRSWTDFWQFWGSPAKGLRKGTWIFFVVAMVALGLPLPWGIIWPESDAIQSAYGTFLFGLLPFYVMGTLRWAYADRFRELWQAGKSPDAGGTARKS